MATLLSTEVGLLFIAAIVVLQARAEKSLWDKCSRDDSTRQMQMFISMGKAHTR